MRIRVVLLKLVRILGDARTEPSAAPVISSSCFFSRRSPNRSEGCFIIRVVRELPHVFDVADPIVRVQDEKGAGKDSQLLDSYTKRSSKGQFAMVGQNRSVVDALGREPPGLGKRKVGAYDDQANTA